MYIFNQIPSLFFRNSVKTWKRHIIAIKLLPNLLQPKSTISLVKNNLIYLFNHMQFEKLEKIMLNDFSYFLFQSFILLKAKIRPTKKNHENELRKKS